MSIKETQLIVLTGCGGVGKTTVSAAIALSLAQQGHQVALITIDPAKRLAQSLNIKEWQAGLQPVSLNPNLSAMMLDRIHSSHRLVHRFSASEAEAQIILDNQYFKAFSRSLAGVQEYMAIYEVYEAIKTQRFDYVVLDTPPAKHAIDFLDAPRKLREALDNSAFQFVLNSLDTSTTQNKSIRQRFTRMGKSIFIKALSTMTADSFIEDLLHFLQIFSEVLKGLKESGVHLESLMQSKQSAYILVSTQEQSVIYASQYLIQQLQLRKCKIQHILINRDRQHLYPASINEEINNEEINNEEIKNSSESQQLVHALTQLQKMIKDRLIQEKKAQKILGSLNIPMSTLPIQDPSITPSQCIRNLTEYCTII
jgi:anion-transporting  ArsA/GET3 family ATPase